MLLKFQLESTVTRLDRDSGPWKSVINRDIQRVPIAYFLDSLPRCSQIMAIVAKNRCARTDLGLTRSRIHVGPEVVVKPP